MEEDDRELGMCRGCVCCPLPPRDAWVLAAEGSPATTPVKLSTNGGWSGQDCFSLKIEKFLVIETLLGRLF